MPYKNALKQSHATLAYKHQKLAWIAELKMTRGCDQCGWKKHPSALAYHHRDPEKKTAAISRMANKNLSNENILAEIEKCDLLCANCHAMQQEVIYTKYMKSTTVPTERWRSNAPQPTPSREATPQTTLDLCANGGYASLPGKWHGPSAYHRLG